jgi:MFS transporter, ACS family, allantoate permease
VPFVNGLAWISLVTAGHTKRITTNTLVLIGYAIGNGASTFMWKAEYQPRYVTLALTGAGIAVDCPSRNHIPWAIITMGSVVSAILLVVIRFMLAAENKRRDAAGDVSSEHDVYIIDVDATGNKIERRVDRVRLHTLRLMHALTQGTRHFWILLIAKIRSSVMCFKFVRGYRHVQYRFPK